MGIQSFKLSSITTFKSLDQLKDAARHSQVTYDNKANAVIVPVLVNKQTREFNFATFHIRMIKNTSINREKNLTFLRINLHNPQNVATSKEIQMPALLGPKAICLKELTLKSENGANLTMVHNKVREALRIIKQRST